ncbi:MAG TPA: C39 family peptidase [Chthoniobacteraceae bacterium]|nr:C39 family peptidase [Chthoniobacteraceae bacterium]
MSAHDHPRRAVDVDVSSQAADPEENSSELAGAAEDQSSVSGQRPGFQLDQPRPRRRRRLILTLAFIAFIVLGSAFGITWWNDWSSLGKIEPRGGLYFPHRLELAVPSFRQGDPLWRYDPLGASDETLGSAGCAISSAAMVFRYYGIDTDPQRLNWFLQEHEGYTPQGWVYWEKAAEFAPERVRHIYEDLPSHRLIDTNLLRGNPVIVRLRMPRGTTHFVVVAGKEGYDYLTRDPGRGANKGLYPLRELGSKIEALRFYEKL